MLFTSVSFLFFFLPAVLLAYYCVRRQGWRNNTLLAFSLFFYGWGGWQYLVAMLASITWNWGAALWLGALQKQGKRGRWLLTVSILGNLALICYYKYLNFFADTAGLITGLDFALAQIAMPIGISFFTFQGLSYVVDVYRAQAKPAKSLARVALYISMFPPLVAGPIVRYNTIARDIAWREETFDDFVSGTTRFVFGFAKKLLLANAMGEISASFFATPAAQLSVAGAWLGALAYTLHIYLDFSAYSDMAIGMGRMFGFHFLENFNFPYVARSVQEFWRRWHISLSTWFRDYVYIPLGGSRVSKGRHIFNLLAVWLLTGLWHGANFTFIAWGVYYGLLLIGERYIWGNLWRRLPAAVQWPCTFVLVMVGWVVFNAESLPHALRYLGAMAGAHGNALWDDQFLHLLEIFPLQWLCAIAAVFPLSGIANRLLENLSKSPVGAVAAPLARYGYALALLAAGVIVLLNTTFNPFIYFRF